MEKNTAPTTVTNSDCLSASELVHRHLQDENHEISEADLQNVALDCLDKTETSNVQVPTADATSIKLNGLEQDEESPDKNEKERKKI